MFKARRDLESTVNYQLVIFDFDGTLADSIPWMEAAFNGVADRFGFRRLEQGEARVLRGLGPRAAMRHLGIPLWKVPSIARHVRERMAANLDEIKLFEGARLLLETLAARGTVVGIASSNSRETVCSLLGPESAACVSYYECGVSLFGKATRLHRILAVSGIPCRRAILVGDELRDLEAARCCGIAFGAVTWGFATPESLIQGGPDEVFSRMDQIADRLA